jgi:hypothetical protein
MRRKLLHLGACVAAVALFFLWRRVLVVPYGYNPGRCRIQAVCGTLAGIDCGSAADGPYNYVRIYSGKTLSYCGGACMGGRCTDCPPAEWTCKNG